MIQYLNNVSWWELRAKPQRKKGACFGGIFYNYATKVSDVADAVIYRAHIHPTVSKENAEFFVDFLSKLLDTKRIKYKIGKGRSKFPTLLLRIETKGFTRVQSLLYLTGFRYVSEYPEIINELVKRKKPESTLEELFSIFQQIHLDCGQGKVSNASGNLAGHGLMYHYGATYKSVTLAEFAANLSNDKTPNVHAHFKPPVAKPSV